MLRCTHSNAKALLECTQALVQAAALAVCQLVSGRRDAALEANAVHALAELLLRLHLNGGLGLCHGLLQLPAVHGARIRLTARLLCNLKTKKTHPGIDFLISN